MKYYELDERIYGYKKEGAVEYISPILEDGTVLKGSDYLHLLETKEDGTRFTYYKLEDGKYIGDLEKEQAEASKKLLSDIENLVVSHMNSTAKEYGYDDVKSAILYIGDPNPTFNAEAVMFRNWRSAVWTYINDELIKFQTGLREVPASNDDIIAELPKLEDYELAE